jgi:hypothetical protein
MHNDIDQRILDYLTIQIMNDSKFICNPHIRVRCAWMEANKAFKRLNGEQKQNILAQMAKDQKDFHAPDFWD